MIKHFLMIIFVCSLSLACHYHADEDALSRMNAFFSDDDYQGKYYSLNIVSFGENKARVIESLRENVHPFLKPEDALTVLAIVPLEEEDALEAKALLEQAGAIVELVEKAQNEIIAS